MTSAHNTALDLLKRLLAGEREDVPLQLAMLLEKSSACDHGDEHYRQILPPELAALRLSPEVRDDIVAAICNEILRNPSQGLIFAVSFTGADQATKTVAQVLLNPPRRLTLSEYQAALALLDSYLPYRIAEDSEFLPMAQLERLMKIAEELQNTEEDGSGGEGSVGISVRLHATEFLKRLKK